MQKLHLIASFSLVNVENFFWIVDFFCLLQLLFAYYVRQFPKKKYIYISFCWLKVWDSLDFFWIDFVETQTVKRNHWLGRFKYTDIKAGYVVNYNLFNVATCFYLDRGVIKVQKEAETKEVSVTASGFGQEWGQKKFWKCRVGWVWRIGSNLKDKLLYCNVGLY